VPSRTVSGKAGMKLSTKDRPKCLPILAERRSPRARQKGGKKKILRSGERGGGRGGREFNVHEKRRFDNCNLKKQRAKAKAGEIEIGPRSKKEKNSNDTRGLMWTGESIPKPDRKNTTAGTSTGRLRRMAKTFRYAERGGRRDSRLFQEGGR